MLQDFARDVERQVVRVDHAAHEAQVGRHQLLGVVHDEHAPHVELDAVPVLAVPQVERRARRDVEQLRVFLAAFDLVVGVGERRFEVVRDVLVELVVLLFGDFDLRPRPQRAGLVDRFVLVRDAVARFVLVPLLFLHQDRQRDVVGVLADDGAQPDAGQQLVLALAQVQRDFGAARLACRRLRCVYSPPPSDSQRTPCSAVSPARRVTSVTLSATMNDE